MSAEDRSAYWNKLGFTEARTFCNEYTLLVNLDTMAKVRIYNNGTEWIADDRTSDYRRVDAEPTGGG